MVDIDKIALGAAREIVDVGTNMPLAQRKARIQCIVADALRALAQRAPTPDLTKALTEFSDFINEPPQYEDKRTVRDYRHELARKWVPLLEQLLALTSTECGDGK